MAVEIYVWFPSITKKNIGHAAMLVDGGSPAGSLYLSRWPGPLSSLVWGPGANFTYNLDVAAEGGPPSVVRLTKLDETAIKAEITACWAEDNYSYGYLNCASQVGRCLRAGIPRFSVVGFIGAATTLQFGLKRAIVHTPPTLYAAAQALRPFFG